MKQINFSKYKPKLGQVLILKSLPATLKATNDFQWPEYGHVEAPDWNEKIECGGGLHGWLWGQGEAELRCKDEDAKWMVIAAKSAGIINLTGKVKFQSGTVVFCGDRTEAVEIISHFAPPGTNIIFGTATAGDRGTATAGYRGTATAGDSGTATAGLYGFIVIEYYDKSKELYLKKMAFVDGVEYLPGVKYRLNDNAQFEPVNDNL